MRLPRGRPPHPGPVTPAEARVLDLVRAGMPNAEIAVRLGISVNTVKYHVARLMEKAETSDRRGLPAAESFPSQRRRRPPNWAIAAGLSLLAVVAVGVALVVFEQPAGSSKSKPIAGLVVAAAAPDGAASGIYSVGETGNAPPQLRFPINGTTRGMAWSPDGRQFAYATEDPFSCPGYTDCPGRPGLTHITLIDNHSGGIESSALGTNALTEHPLSWDNSGHLIVLTQSGPGAAINDHVRVVSEFGLACVSLSVNAQSAACARVPIEGQGSEVFAMVPLDNIPADVTGWPKLTPMPGDAGQVVLSPDSHWCLVSAVGRGLRTLLVMPVNLVAGTFAPPVPGASPPATVPGTDPVWAPDSQSFAYLDSASPGIHLFDTANGQSRQLTTGGDFQPVWSPDGTRIAFLRSDGQSNELHIVNVATGDERRIEMGKLVPGLIAWGPELEAA